MKEEEERYTRVFQPCIEIKEGSTVAIAETRPLGKNIAHVVLGEVKTGA